MNRFYIGFLIAPLAFAAPTVTTQPNPRTNFVSLGVTLSNRIGASSQHGPITFQWKLNGTNIPGRTNVSITLTNISLPSAGSYSAVATDADGSAESAAWVVDVDPTFTKVSAGAFITPVAGVGTVWGDFNNDGLPDLAMAGNSVAIFTNQSGTNLAKLSSTYLSGLSFNANAAAVDVDNDGWLDLLVTSYSGASLARNSNGVFRAAGTIAIPFSVNGFGAAFADYDRDGNIDVFFTSGFSKTANSLYRNVNGVFKFATNSVPVKDSPEYSQSASWGDYDNDGWPDLFVANARDYNAGGAGRKSFLYHNRGNGQFEKITNAITTNLFGLAQGIWADFDNDGRLDLFACGYILGSSSQRRLLFHNDGNGAFTRMTNAGSICTDSGYDQGAAAIDYDNDGWLDIFITSGGPNAFNDALYHNNGDGTFTRMHTGSLVNDQGEGAGCSWGDFNHDGFLDLYVSNFQNQTPEKNAFYINSGNSNHWLAIKCVGRISNRSAVGAKVRALATINGKSFWQMREISATSGYLSGSSLDVNFGLGDAGQVDTIRVEWPSGIVQELGPTAANQFLTIEEPFRMTMTRTNENCLIQTQGRGSARIEKSVDLLSWLPWQERHDTNMSFATPAGEATAFFRMR